MTARPRAGTLTGPTRRGWTVATVLLAVVLASLWFGHAPPRSPAAYDREAGHTVSLMASQLRTGVLWSREHAAGEVTSAATEVALDEAVDDARNTLDRFTGYLPPPGRHFLRTRVSEEGSAAVEQLGLMRIAAHEHDWARLRELTRQAEDTTTALSGLAEGLPR